MITVIRRWFNRHMHYDGCYWDGHCPDRNGRYVTPTQTTTEPSTFGISKGIK